MQPLTREASPAGLVQFGHAVSKASGRSRQYLRRSTTATHTVHSNMVCFLDFVGVCRCGAVQLKVNGVQFDFVRSSARAPQRGARVDELTKSRKIPTRKILTLFFFARVHLRQLSPPRPGLPGAQACNALSLSPLYKQGFADSSKASPPGSRAHKADVSPIAE